jgi:hypothetical protein
MFNLWTDWWKLVLGFLALLGFFLLPGCSANDHTNWTPREWATLVVAARMAGFSGQASIDLDANSEAYLINGAGLRSNGTRGSLCGQMNATAISPEEMRMWLEALERLDANIEPDVPPPG